MEQGACELFMTQHLPFWANLTQQQKELLCANTLEVHHHAGEIIHGGDDDCIGVLLIKKGILRTYLMGEDGREVTMYRQFAGDICLLTAACTFPEITYDAYVDVEEELEAEQIAAPIFHKLMDENIYVKSCGYQLLTERYSDVMWAMQQILFMGVDKRIAIFLMDEVSKSGSSEIPMTHEQIAKLIGSAREVVTRMLKYFQNEGIVHLSRGCVEIVDKEKLRDLTRG